MNAAAYYRSQASQCRKLARLLSSRPDRSAMLALARYYDGEALNSDRRPGAR